MESLKPTEYEQYICETFPKHLNICNLNQFCEWYELKCFSKNENMNKQIEDMINTWLRVSMISENKKKHKNI